jgi:hypothetical protein
VDHEVHDHRVLRYPGGEGAEAPRLHEDGALHDLPQLLNGAVEALDVPHVEHTIAGAGHPEELLGLLQGRRHRFLDEHVHARLEELARDLEVLLGRHRHRRDVDEARQLAIVAKGPGAVGRGQVLGAREVNVHDPDQIHVPELHQGEDVVLTHVAGADHARP